MKDFATVLLALMIGAPCSVTALAQHYVVTGDTENGPGTTTLFRLAGSTLSAVKTLKTGGKGVSQAGVTWLASNRQAVIKHGSEVCAFVSDSGSSDVAAFKGPTLPQSTRVGNYSDVSLVGNVYGIALAATPDSNILFAGYPASVNIGVWLINSDCSLSLALTVKSFAVIDAMKVSPDGATLVVTFGAGARCGSRANCQLDSYAISGTTLNEKGPYHAGVAVGGIDFTRDSRYAILGLAVSDTAIDVFPINSDSSLGKAATFFFANQGVNSNNVWLSPDERFLYVANNFSFQVTTINFKESPLSLTFGCLANLHDPGLGQNRFAAGISTEAQAGAGGYLYVAESGSKTSAVGLLTIDRNTGCATEVNGSPYLTGQGYGLGSLSAFPPRPF